VLLVPNNEDIVADGDENQEQLTKKVEIPAWERMDHEIMEQRRLFLLHSMYPPRKFSKPA